jgi:hypothetical protein
MHPGKAGQAQSCAAQHEPTVDAAFASGSGS